MPIASVKVKEFGVKRATKQLDSILNFDGTDMVEEIAAKILDNTLARLNAEKGVGVEGNIVPLEQPLKQQVPEIRAQYEALGYSTKTMQLTGRYKNAIASSLLVRENYAHIGVDSTKFKTSGSSSGYPLLHQHDSIREPHIQFIELFTVPLETKMKVPQRPIWAFNNLAKVDEQAAGVIVRKKLRKVALIKRGN